MIIILHPSTPNSVTPHSVTKCHIKKELIFIVLSPNVSHMCNPSAYSIITWFVIVYCINTRDTRYSSLGTVRWNTFTEWGVTWDKGSEKVILCRGDIKEIRNGTEKGTFLKEDKNVLSKYSWFTTFSNRDQNVYENELSIAVPTSWLFWF